MFFECLACGDMFESRTHELYCTACLRTCALCLEYIPRKDYRRHMQEDHGYTTLETNPREAS